MQVGLGPILLLFQADDTEAERIRHAQLCHDQPELLDSPGPFRVAAIGHGRGGLVIPFAELEVDCILESTGIPRLYSGVYKNEGVELCDLGGPRLRVRLAIPSK